MRAFDAVRESLAAEDPEHISFIHEASQYDVDYNCISTEMEVNTRNDKCVLVGSNGLHITPMGSHQIADAVLRHLSARFWALDTTLVDP